MAKQFHRNNCSPELRAQITDKYGRVISLFGRYAFEWSIVMEVNGRVVINTYPKGNIARKEFNKYKKK